jgi:hypothetical protein
MMMLMMMCSVFLRRMMVILVVRFLVAKGTAWLETLSLLASTLHYNVAARPFSGTD